MVSLVTGGQKVQILTIKLTLNGQTFISSSIILENSLVKYCVVSFFLFKIPTCATTSAHVASLFIAFLLCVRLTGSPLATIYKTVCWSWVMVWSVKCVPSYMEELGSVMVACWPSKPEVWGFEFPIQPMHIFLIISAFRDNKSTSCTTIGGWIKIWGVYCILGNLICQTGTGFISVIGGGCYDSISI